ncbi:serine/threonine-protein kinase [Streptomyces coelicoflavus]|uniref:serine/threonine-protein kinase n=1 Tax=Streptomyces coelicoflavus TaxID=285562 RepID=UPI0036AA5C6C
MTEGSTAGGMGLVALAGEERRLGPYRLLGQLATGGMGLIYLGRNVETGRLAAVKTVLAPGGVSDEARRRFRREAALAARVSSNRTARVLDSDAGAAKPWMAMEYVPAPSLEALVVQRGALNGAGAVCRVGRGVAEALVDLHGKKIVHRDVKPLNVLLTAAGPKVIDFGISHASDLTSTRLTLGTIAFAAPEQAEGQSCTAASDVYSLGVTLYYVACGRLPYPYTTEPLQQLNYVRQADIDLADLPDGLAGPVGACLSRDPAGRPTARELAQSLSVATEPLPADWNLLIASYAREGRRLEQATGLSEAETLVRDWTTPRTRVLTEAPDGNGTRSEPKKRKPHKPRTQEERKRKGQGPGKPPVRHQDTRPARPEPEHRTEPPAETEAPKTPTAEKSTPAVGTVVRAIVVILAWALILFGWDSVSAALSEIADRVASVFAEQDDAGTRPGAGPGADTGKTPGVSASESAAAAAFARVRPDDCLRNLREGTVYPNDWTPSTPTRIPCSAEAAVYRVTTAGKVRCSVDKTVWRLSLTSSTVLCLARNYVAGQCLKAGEIDDDVKIYGNTIRSCFAADETLVRITAVRDNASEDSNVCGADRRWDLDDGTVLCGRLVG